ncbi:MAG: Cytoplasmic protein [Promethearchaeota archaeon]|nr:MAG: Cytoplasmic protein [Candidatus Lokiarchaeota archaeon]
MGKYLKPKIVISKCIEFDRCRYNGAIISSDIVKVLKNFVEFIPVCAEVEIELAVPRDPIRIVKRNEELILIQSSTGLDVTKRMNSFAAQFLNSLEYVDGFILKYKSPSCGTKHTPYLASTQKGAAKVGKGPGLFGKAVLERFPKLAIENEGRLNNFRIREHFLTKLYTHTRFRNVKNSNSMHQLVQFQANNKFLFMAYNQELMRKMGRIVANEDKKPFQEVIKDYEIHLLNLIAYPPKYTANINVLMHMLGYFSKQLTHEEKAYFLDELEKYRAGWIPLFVMTHLLKSWIVRFNQEYLSTQTFFEPFPEELMIFDLKNTWRGRSYWQKPK